MGPDAAKVTLVKDGDLHINIIGNVAMKTPARKPIGPPSMAPVQPNRLQPC